MLKLPLTYTTFDDEEITEEFYFNISTSEFIEYEVEYEEGLLEVLKRIIKTKDRKGIITEMKKIILLAYGKRSPDGKSFMKSDEMREAFSHTAAYQTLFMKLSLDDQFAADFLIGVFPKDFSEELAAGFADVKSKALEEGKTIADVVAETA